MTPEQFFKLQTGDFIQHELAAKHVRVEIGPNAAGTLYAVLPMYIGVTNCANWGIVQDRPSGPEAVKALGEAAENSNRITQIAESMPGGTTAYMKQWGYEQFAKCIQANKLYNEVYDAGVPV